MCSHYKPHLDKSNSFKVRAFLFVKKAFAISITAPLIKLPLRFRTYKLRFPLKPLPINSPPFSFILQKLISKFSSVLLQFKKV